MLHILTIAFYKNLKLATNHEATKKIIGLIKSSVFKNDQMYFVGMTDQRAGKGNLIEKYFRDIKKGIGKKN